MLQRRKAASELYFSEKRESNRSQEEFEKYYQADMDLVYEIADYFEETATLLPSMGDLERSCETLLRKRFKEYKE